MRRALGLGARTCPGAHPAMMIGGASAVADPGALPTHGLTSATAPSSAALTRATAVENNSPKLKFALRACNRTRNSIWISIGAREEGEGEVVRGWLVAGLPHQCRLLGKSSETHDLAEMQSFQKQPPFSPSVENGCAQ